jgi:DNA-binding CsgD family transcriptional regulator
MTGSVFKEENAPPGNKVMPLSVTGLIRARRNDPGAMQLIEEALGLALQMGENEKITTAAAAKAEAYWLQNKLPDIIDELESIYERVKKTNNAWAIGEIAFWLWKAGRLFEIPQGIAKPFLLQIRGDWKSAAEKWEELQCPYEQALALSDGNNDTKIKAIEIFNGLGATAAVQLIKQKMRVSGIKGIPKGPRKTTRENLAGLTNRQIEVLHLVSKGLSNNEIGNQLYISAKTVDHHISTILSKLNIHSRFEAAAYLQSGNILKNRG